jgi:hypothetical protein
MKTILVELSDEAASRWKRWLRADAWDEMSEAQREHSRLYHILAQAEEQRKVVESHERTARLAREIYESIFGPMPIAREGDKWIYSDGYEEK